MKMINYLRDDLIDIKSYDVEAENHVYKMDANESPWDLPESIRKTLAEELMNGNQFNRYPDSNASRLRQAIGKYCNVSPDQIIVGSGSDELIGMLITAFLDKDDAVVYPTPSFSMYRYFTLIAGGKPVEVPLGKQFQYDLDIYTPVICKYNPKVLFLCSPNNPTGNVLEPDRAKDIIQSFPGVVVVDEAYVEFTNKTILDYVSEYPNLVVLRTFSKAFGLAGLRIGYCVSNSSLINQIRKVKPPYNISSFSQRVATLTLENIDMIKGRLREIIKQREFLFEALKEISSIKVYPSEANFFLIQVKDGNSIWRKLLDRGFMVRNFTDHPYLENCLRITVADEVTNRKFLKVLMDIVV
jgi:histidinol-phosphate aminotransferase